MAMKERTCKIAVVIIIFGITLQKRKKESLRDFYHIVIQAV